MLLGGFIIVSSNHGVTSQSSYIGYPIGVYSIFSEGSFLYAGTYDGIYVSPDRGQTWSHSSGMNSLLIWSITSDGSNIYAGTGQNGVFISADNGQTFAPTAFNTRGVT